MTLIASILGGLGRSRRVPRTGLWQLNSKRGPRNFYKGKGVAPTGRHTRKGDFRAPYQVVGCCKNVDEMAVVSLPHACGVLPHRRVCAG